MYSRFFGGWQLGAYKYFSKAGYNVYTIDDDLTTENINALMTAEEQKVNKRLAMQQFTQSPVVERLKDILERIHRDN